MAAEFWDDWTDDELAALFGDTPPEVHVAASAAEGTDLKCTDPATLARVAEIITAPDDPPEPEP
jgi:hypothetical protein